VFFSGPAEGLHFDIFLEIEDEKYRTSPQINL